MQISTKLWIIFTNFSVKSEIRHIKIDFTEKSPEEFIEHVKNYRKRCKNCFCIQKIILFVYRYYI